jgi:ATP/maltotriose-dependent transcriptional regulator MalT
MGEQAFLSTTAAFLARAVMAQGRLDEAAELTQQSADLAEPGDLLTQIMWRGVQARVLAGRGQIEDGERLAREGVALAEETDFLAHRGDALIDLAAILHQSGRSAEATATAAAAMDLHHQKGNLVAADDIRSHLEAL